MFLGASGAVTVFCAQKKKIHVKREIMHIKGLLKLVHMYMIYHVKLGYNRVNFRQPSCNPSRILIGYASIGGNLDNHYIISHDVSCKCTLNLGIVRE